MLLERKILWFTFVSVFTIATDATQNLQARLCCRCLRIALPPPNVTVHILHDDTLTQDNRDKFSYIAGRYGQLIKFYNVEKICAKEIEKIIYFDSDIIINLDINEMWQIPLGDKPLAAIASIENGSDPKTLILCKKGLIKPEDIFNSGVMILNLKRIRNSEQENIWAGINWLLENSDAVHFDNDILNYSFANNYVKISKKFNVTIFYRRKYGDFQTADRVIHYAGKLLFLDFSDSFNKIWFSYFRKTPWFNENVIAHLNEEYRKIINQRDIQSKNFALQMTALMSGKSRAFVTTPPNVNAVKNYFFIHNDEEIIQLVNQESLNVLAKSMAESRGKKIFFILFGDYEQLKTALINAGFVEGRDFINAAMFLSDANGVSLNTYPLVKAM